MLLFSSFFFLMRLVHVSGPTSSNWTNLNCFSQTDDSIQVYLYSGKLQKQSPQGALYCEVNTLLYSGEKSQESNNPPISKHFVMVGRQNSLLAGRTRLVCSDWLGVQGKDKKRKEKGKK